MDAITGVQASLARKAKEVAAHRFGDLWSLLCREEWIRYALNHVLTNTGGRTAGIDGISRAKLQDEETINRFIRELQGELRTKTFKPNPVRRVYIPKANGKQRPLGIPTIKDRTVQMLLKMVLEPIWESDFLNCSNGFRINRCTMDCIAMLWTHATSKTKMYWAIEGDIRGCFDHIHHVKLLELIAKRIQDVRILQLVEDFLVAGVMEGQLFVRTEEGTPQGGIVSPLLANIYLHELDCYWWTHYGSLDGRERKRRRATHQGNHLLIRYADDFVLLTNGPKSEAERLKTEFGDFLREELKLELSPAKTLITHVNDGFDFLGFHIRRFTHPKQGGKPVVLVFPSEEGITRFKAKVRELTAVGKIADPLDTLRAYNRIAQGWAHYYRYVNAKRVYQALDYWAFRRLLHWLARHHRIGTRQARTQYVCEQPSPTGTKSNLAVKDDKGKLLYRYSMATLAIQRFLPRRLENPYLTGDMATTASGTGMLELPDVPIIADAYGRERRREKLEQVGYRCERCGSPDNLEIHHIKPARGRDRSTLNHPLEWLQVFCESCHHAVHHSQTK